MTQEPSARSIVQGIPSPAATTARPGGEGGAQLPLERLEHLVGAQPGDDDHPPVENLAIVPENPDEHLRAAEIDADRLGAGRPGHRGKAGFGEAMGQYYRVMAPGDPDRPERPEYKVYRAGSGGGGWWRRDKKPAPDAGEEPAGAKADEPAKKAGPPDEGSGYKVYKARRGFKRPGAPDLSGLRGKLGSGGGSKSTTPGEKPLWRRIARWAFLALGAWLLLSVVLFVVSSQIQKGKLDDAVGDELGGFPLLVASPQTILVMGTDARPEGSDEAGAETDPKCLEAAATGGATANICAVPSRADTLMLVRAGGGAFEKLSIPRDTLAEIPGEDAQKINAAYAFGGAALQVRTVENFLGIEIDHVVILDFEGFADFIDAVGGVTVDLPKRVKSLISGGSSNGGLTLKLEAGREHARRPGGAGPGPHPREPARSLRGRPRARPAPAADPRRHPGPADQPDPDSLQPDPRPLDRLERAEGDGQRHGRADACRSSRWRPRSAATGGRRS